MSAVPKKKLCWNCEGNVARNIDNCPYCGVYVHAGDDEEENSLWNLSYVSSSKTEEIPTPLYQVFPQEESASEKQKISSLEEREGQNSLLDYRAILKQFKRDVFPILFLMMGSIFFLFGIVLFLFSQNGTLTLQWKEESAFYFLLFALPLIGFGWILLQKVDNQ